MSQDDPFSPFEDGDKTQFRRPSPGGRAAPPPPGPAYAEPEPERLAAFADNPVVAAALPLLSLVSSLHERASPPPDIDGLRRQLVGEIRAFQNKILPRVAAPESAGAASYALCALLDETIVGTPWGWQNNWGQKTLQTEIHKELLGGDKFFPIVDRLRQQPAQNLDVIELCYLCLSLGFQGKYRQAADGLNALERYREDLYLLIQRHRGGYERGLSPRWQGLRDLRGGLARAVPLWVAGAVAAALLVLAYLGFWFSVSAASDQARAQLAALGKEPIKIAASRPPPAPKPPAPGRKERFVRLLAGEIGKDMVEVVDDRLLRVRNAFPTGSDQVKPEFADMLRKIAGELAAGQDWAEVSGHTDNVRIHTARFDDNWALSKARANHVADFLAAAGVARGKLRTRGAADQDPLAPNDTPDGRAKNRRVDILIQ